LGRVPGPWIDVTLPLTPSLPTWPGDPRFQLRRLQSIAEGSAANVSELQCSVHTGTHVDAPLHFIDGAPAVDRLPLEVLVGPCTVVGAEAVEGVLRPVDLPPALDAERVLFRTRNSRRWADTEAGFARDYVAVGEALAEELVRRGTRLVGVDYLSVERFDSHDHAVHRTLLGAGIVIVEGLDLSAAEPGAYELCCLPLKLVGSDGSPARVLIRSP
jgi:arylformamidase